MGRFIIIILIGACTGGVICGQPTSAVAKAALRPAGPPPMPVASPRTPVDFFRDLLAMSKADREKSLTNRSAQVRVFIEARL